MGVGGWLGLVPFLRKKTCGVFDRPTRLLDLESVFLSYEVPESGRAMFSWERQFIIRSI